MALVASWRAYEHRLRRQILSHARGNVLEISVGPGINFNYYPFDVSVTATDLSVKMIQKARLKALESGIDATFIVSSTTELDLPMHSFDTVVSTFSICEYERPAEALNQFNYWCKPGGTVLLLEPGLSNFRLLRLFQKMLARGYYKKTGSHIDLDLKSIIASSPLSIRTLERKLGGILYIVLATPSDNNQRSYDLQTIKKDYFQ